MEQSKVNAPQAQAQTQALRIDPPQHQSDESRAWGRALSAEGNHKTKPLSAEDPAFKSKFNKAIGDGSLQLLIQTAMKQTQPKMPTIDSE